MWEQQLNSMLEAGHLDAESFSDLAVAYAAETGDACYFSIMHVHLVSPVITSREASFGQLSRSQSRMRNGAWSQSRSSFWFWETSRSNSNHFHNIHASYSMGRDGLCNRSNRGWSWHKGGRNVMREAAGELTDGRLEGRYELGKAT